MVIAGYQKRILPNLSRIESKWYNVHTRVMLDCESYFNFMYAIFCQGSLASQSQIFLGYTTFFSYLYSKM